MATGRVPTTANSPLTAKGDLFTYSTAPARLAVGNNGETLIADSTASTGLKWAKSSNFVGCSVYDSGSTQTLANNTYTALTFNSETIDTDGFHSTTVNTSRLTIPTGLGGRYAITVSPKFAPSAVGIRTGAVYKNGGVLLYLSEVIGSATAYVSNNVTYLVDLAAGDFIELVPVQTSGGNLDVYKRLADNIFNLIYLGA